MLRVRARVLSLLQPLPTSVVPSVNRNQELNFFFFFLKFVMEGLDKHFMVDVFIQTETKKNWTACFFFI